MKYLFVTAAFAFFALNAPSLGAQTITVSPNDCQALTAYTPSDDVAYKPGVDVDGNAVAPADLNSSGQLNLDTDHEFWLPIDVPLQDVITIDPADNMDAIRASDIGVGTVTVKNGQACFNGEPLGDADSHAVAAECARQQDPTAQ
ncbi:MAG: hypothetical protein QF767_14405 [Alphaproteobacteria bacterium]|nr:hypothetical protein [Alphaproteobacteria bacterium]